MTKLLTLALITLLIGCTFDGPFQAGQKQGQRSFQPVGWQIDTVFRGESYKSYEFSFVDEQIGYIVSNNYGDIWKTVDGGRTWKPQSSIAGDRPGEFYPKAITFLNENVGFISLQDTRRCPNDCQTRYSLLTTKDGGKTWGLVQTESKGVLQQIHFSSPTEGVATATEGLVTGSSQLVLLRTTNGGQSWQSVAGIPVGSSVSELYFVDRLTGFVRGRDRQFYGTLDGGQTWTFIANQLPNQLYSPYQFVDQKIGFMPAYDGFYQTTDGGQTWKQAWSGRTTLVGFVTKQEGFAIRTIKAYPNDIPDEDRELLRTTDGGTSWQAYPPVHNLEIPFVQFVSERTGFFTKGSLILRVSRK